jgi:hypothetical protein
MACRKLAQQRVLRIMQQQSAEQTAVLTTERSAECDSPAQKRRMRRPSSEKRDL